MGDRSADYQVGYGKPPAKTRFKKGESGNPKGRPKSRDLTPAERLRKLLQAPQKSAQGTRTKHTAQDRLMAQLAHIALEKPSAAQLLFDIAYPRTVRRTQLPAGIIRDANELTEALYKRMLRPFPGKTASGEEIAQEYEETIRLQTREHEIRAKIEHVDLPKVASNG